MLMSKEAVCVTENKNQKLLPKILPGAVCAQMVRCGKPTCKCGRGELHGPYFYRFVWEYGTQRKVYIRKDMVEQIQDACETHRDEARKQRAQRKTDRLSFRSMLADLAEFEKVIAQINGE
jgi:hypothetical protein